MKKLLTFAAVLLVVAGCSGQNSQNTTAANATVNLQSLAGNAKVPDTLDAAAMAQYPKKGSAIARNFAEQPPLIPHKTYSITQSRNSCMACHAWNKADRMKATPIAKSHVVDNQGTLNGQNYFCTQCHVPQADNKSALVGNSFKM